MPGHEAGAAARLTPLLERLHGLHPRLIDLSLDRLRRLLGQLGHPERLCAPVIHVAGTNGKGSTCAMLRAMAEAAGLRVHVYTSPHLVRFNERFRIAGRLVDDRALADTFEEIERVNGGAPITVFEVFTAAAFLLFSRAPAELAVLETGLGGRGDATNVIERPAACAITALSLDHREMLGDSIEAIAAEKAGIIKPGVPVITGAQPDAALAVLRAAAARQGAALLARGEAWSIGPGGAGLQYRDAQGGLAAPFPSLRGEHQIDNAGIALAALRAALPGIDPRCAQGLARAEWPARMQRLHGRLARLLPRGAELWLDGGHNPGAGQALAAELRGWNDRPLHLVVGMKLAKDAEEFLRPLLPLADSLWAVQEPGQHLAMPIEAILAVAGGRARPGPDVTGALGAIAGAGGSPRVLICGSLYLAGEVLKLDGEEPA